MYRPALKAFLAALVASTAGTAFAADLYEPPVIETTPPPVYQEAPYGGWYIRGDLDYHLTKMRGANYVTYGCCGNVDPGTNDFDTASLKGSFSLGGGVGYQISRYLRTDLTADYWFKSNFEGSTSGVCGGNPCTSVEVSKFSALLLLANAYADLGTYHGITPYVGAGIGGARVKWDDVYDPNTTEFNPGASNWRFAYAVMAGASYCLTDRAKLDVGYRFSHIEGGRMFEYHPSSAGPGFDKGFNTHEVRAGVRYQFSGRSECSEPEPIPYEPPTPIYK